MAEFTPDQVLAQRRKMRARLYRHLFVAADALGRANDVLEEEPEYIDANLPYVERQLAIAAEALAMMQSRVADYKREYLKQGGESNGEDRR